MVNNEVKLLPGLVPAFSFHIGTLLMEYINEGGDTTFLSAPSPEMEAENSLPAALTALDDLGIDTASTNSAYFDYLTANAETKGRALTNAITATNATIDTAIAEQQAAGADTSALAALKAQLDSALSAAGRGQTGTNTLQDAVPDVGDLFVQYADTVGVDAMPTFAEFERMYDEGGAAWNELSLKKAYKESLSSGEIEPFTSIEEYKAMVDGEAESGYNDSGNVTKFGYYLRKMKGNPPADMVDPHAHHILFKEGLGDAQKALVKEGQALLRRYGIDPIRGLENLVWAPYRIVGQHDIAALRNVVEQLKAVEKFGGTLEFIRKGLIKQLRLLGEQAASRR